MFYVEQLLYQQYTQLNKHINCLTATNSVKHTHKHVNMFHVELSSGFYGIVL